MGGHLFCIGGDTDTLFATISCTTMTQEADLGSKTFFLSVKVVYSTMSLHEGLGMNWYRNLYTK